MVLSLIDFAVVLVAVLWQVETDVQLQAILYISKLTLAVWLTARLLEAAGWLPEAAGLI